MEQQWLDVDDDDTPVDTDVEHPDALDRFEGADDDDKPVPSEFGSEEDVWGA